MLHRCESCHQLYLTSDYYRLCSWCGEQHQQHIEKLSEGDGAVEWWQVAVVIASGEQQQPRWRIT